MELPLKLPCIFVKNFLLGHVASATKAYPGFVHLLDIFGTSVMC